MAIAGGDGSITLSTKIDETGLKQGFSSIKSSVKNMSSSFMKLGGIIGAAFSIATIVRFSNEASKAASTTEASVQRLVDIYGEASKSLGEFIDTNARSIGMSKSVAFQISAIYGNLFSVMTDQKTNAEMTTQYLNMTAVLASKTGRTIEDVQERVRSGLLGNTEAIEDLGVFVNIKTIEMTDAFKRMSNGKSWEQLDALTQMQVRSMAILEQATQKYGTTVANTSAFTRQQYNAAFQDFQATWGKVVNIVLMPILRVATQILNTLTAGLRLIAGLTGKTIDESKLQAATATDTADAIGGAVDNQDALTDATKETVKEQRKLLAGFDEIEILSQNAADGAGGSGGGGGAGAAVGGGDGLGNLDILGNGIDEGEYTSKLAVIGAVVGIALVGLGIILMFSGHWMIGIAMIASGYILSNGAIEGAKTLGEEEKKDLAVIGAIAGSVLLGLGILLLFTPFWKLGLGMVAAGALSIYDALELASFSEDVKTLVCEILVIAGLVAFTLGVIVLFIGSAGMWKYGLGLMVLGVAEVAGALYFGGAELKTALSTFVATYWKELYAIGILMVVVGVALLFSPKTWMYALTLLTLGVGELVAVTSFGGEKLKTELEKFAIKYWKELYAIGILMLVVGVALLFINAAATWGYALTLIALGIITIVDTTNFGGADLKTELETFANTYWKELYAIGILMVVLGVVLLFINAVATWKYALTLIALGIVGIVSTTLLGGEDLKTELIKTVVGFKDELVKISELLLVLGVVLLFIPGMWGYGLTLIGLSVVSFWGATKLDNLEMKTQLKANLDDLNTTAEEGVNKINKTLSGIGGDTSISGGGGASGGGSATRVPGHAKGTVVPPNNPYLAMLGDNKNEPEVVSPISTMKMAVMEALSEMGGARGTTEVILEIDGREFGRAVIDQGERENRRIGTRLVMS